MKLRMIAVFGIALFVLASAFPPEALPQDAIPGVPLAPAVLQSDAGPGSRTLTIPRVLRRPKLEDFLNGEKSNNSVVVTDFRQRDPGDGVPASQKTSAFLSYDDKNLYVVFVCQDDPDQVRGRMSVPPLGADR